MILLKPGEPPPPVFPDHEPPPGYRWETDAEFRARILEALEEGKER
jgi:hypothetical protein